MFSFITPTTDPKIADVVGMSPLMTEITLGHQTMMSSVSRCCLVTGGTSVEQAFHAMMTEIQAIVTVGGGGKWSKIAHQDL